MAATAFLSTVQPLGTVKESASKVSGVWAQATQARRKRGRSIA
jgi:hypothetical protein